MPTADDIAAQAVEALLPMLDYFVELAREADTAAADAVVSLGDGEPIEFVDQEAAVRAAAAILLRAATRELSEPEPSLVDEPSEQSEPLALADAHQEDAQADVEWTVVDDAAHEMAPAAAEPSIAGAWAALHNGDHDEAARMAETLAFHGGAGDPVLPADQRVHEANIIVGHVHLARGDIQSAEDSLLAAGRVDGVGALSTDGPTVTLAKELIEHGRRQAVLEFLAECDRWWSKHLSRVPQWVAAIERGDMPDWGANLAHGAEPAAAAADDPGSSD